MSKIAIIGPLSKDEVFKMDNSYRSPGGPIYFQARLLNSLKINISALITLSKSDEQLLDEFGENMEIIPLFKEKTMEFKNIYPTDNPDFRIQKACIPFNPIEVDDIKIFNIDGVDIILLGPLCPYDIPLKTIKFLSKSNIPLYLGVQGYLRHLNGNKVVLNPWNGFKEYLKFIKIIFMDENEARIILNKETSLKKTAKILSSFGPEEVIITQGSSGALIYSKKLDRFYKIPAFKANHIVDPTGMGDTFMAAYSAKKLEIEDPEECGKFAAAASCIKIENKGPFNKNKDSIQKRMEI